MRTPPRLPFAGELISAKEKERRHRETVVFVHNYGGSKRSVLRHVRMINGFGYDAICFNLDFNSIRPHERLPITGDLRFGARHIWTQQIEAILNATPGPKIVYSFSMPSNSALEAIARRHAEDITAFICDSGPFVHLPRCTWNLYTHQFRVKNRIVRGLVTAFALGFYGPGFKRELTGFFRQIPHGFPVLSIRGLKDPLVPPAAIDDVFKNQTHLRLETFMLPDAQHLDGLKNFPGLYAPRIEGFLTRVASEVV